MSSFSSLSLLSLQTLFADQSQEGAEHIIATTQSALEGDAPADIGKPHTLKTFSIDHFRVPPKRTLSRTLSRGAFKRKDSNELWAFTRVRTLAQLTIGLETFTVSPSPLIFFLSILSSPPNPHTFPFPFSRQDPIKLPLLKKLSSHSDEIQQKGTTSFLDILANFLTHCLYTTVDITVFHSISQYTTVHHSIP